MRMYYLISASALLCLFIFFSAVSGLSTMGDSHSVGAFNLTNDSVNSRYKNPRLLVVGFPDRIGLDCAKEDIVVNQAATSPLPNGIPTYTVYIVNVCRTGCSIAEIHLTCGWFSSARMINPKLFKRLNYNDCLVNDGKPLKPGGSISIQYANTFKYPMEVSYVKCLP
ncbi:hypothetical protein SUGI_1030660 [Cryptomeria japonica]|nr:hypothetical protein SUGI_1030660 [Cryptomeria japonica]